MQNDVFFIVAVFFFFFCLWLISGGPNKPISFAGPYITPIATINDTQVGYGAADGGSPDITSPQDIARGISNIYDSITHIKSQIADVQLWGEESPYKGEVYLQTGDLSGKKGSEYLSLYNSGDENVTITGWRLVSLATNHSARIPEGTLVISQGSINRTSPIVLEPGEDAIINTKKSPLGVSFRENKCEGYLAKYQDFYPSLDESCPDASDEFDERYVGNKLRDDTCYNLMQDTGTCETPEESKHLSSACFAVIDAYLNYNGCVASHRGDPDFTNGTWRIYLGKDDALWKTDREAIRLLDQNGKTVDVLEY